MKKIILLKCVEKDFQVEKHFKHIKNIEYVSEGICYSDAIFSLEDAMKKYNTKNVKYMYANANFEKIYFRKKWFGRLKFDPNIIGIKIKVSDL